MKFGVTVGLYLPGGGADPEHLVTLVEAAERLEFHSIWTGDHIVVPDEVDETAHVREVGGTHQRPADGNVLEPITTYCYLAGKVSRIRLGIGALIVPYRNPVLAAKMLAMLDVLSAGRLILGVAVGWMREEFVALAAPPFEERGRVTDEYLSALIQLWTRERPRSEGRFVHVGQINLEPKPVQKPHPPLWIGGNGAVALKRAARIGQGWLPVYQTPEDMRTKIAQLESLCEAFGRDPRSMERAVGLRFRFAEASDVQRRSLIGRSDDMLELIRAYEESGVTQINLLAGGHTGITDLINDWERFADTVRCKV